MPERHPDEFKLGLTVIVIIILFFGTLLFIAGRGAWGRKTQTIAVHFQHTLALPVLKPGAEVRCGGQKVGTVDQVEMREVPTEQLEPAATTAPATRPHPTSLAVVVTAHVDAALGLRQDCQITAEGPTLGGSGWLVIRNRGTSPTHARSDQPIAGQPPVGFGAVTETLNQLADRLSGELNPQNPQGLLATIKDQLDATIATSVMGKLHRSIDDINFITASINQQLDPSQQQALLSKLSRSMDDVNRITTSLRQQLDPTADQVALTKIHASLDALNVFLDQAVAMVQENRQPIHETVLHVRGTAQTLDERIAQAIAEQLDVNNHASLMAKIHRDMDLLNQSLQDMNRITGNTRELIALNRPAVAQMLTNFKETSDHLKAASKDLRRNPWRLLYQPSDKETRELNVFDAARSFADAATELDDASARLEALAKANQLGIPPDDPELQAVRQQLQETFQKFSQAEKTLWSILNVR